MILNLSQSHAVWRNRSVFCKITKKNDHNEYDKSVNAAPYKCSRKSHQKPFRKQIFPQKCLMGNAIDMDPFQTTDKWMLK